MTIRYLDCISLIRLIKKWKCYTKDEYYEKMISYLSSKHTTREELESWTFINNILNIYDPWGGYDKPDNAYGDLYNKISNFFIREGVDLFDKIQIICDDRLEE